MPRKKNEPQKRLSDSLDWHVYHVTVHSKGDVEYGTFVVIARSLEDASKGAVTCAMKNYGNGANDRRFHASSTVRKERIDCFQE